MLQRFPQRSELQPREHLSAREKSFAALSSKPPQFFVPRRLDLAGAERNERMVAPGACSETLFPSTKLQGLQETDPGSLLGLRTPEVMEEVVSGRRTTGSLYSPPLSIPTTNPVSKSAVGMMGRGSQRGKRPLTSSWEGKIFLEVPGRGTGREGKPLPLSGSKLHAVPAYSPVPAAKQTVSSGEPSLLLALNFSPVPSVSTGLIPKTSTATLSSPEEEWGKTLALSDMCETTPAAVRSSLSEPKHIGYQDRFVHLQAFLKKCDDDEQEDLLQALQSLPAAARSEYAVELETRAMGLSFEEGKEMSRVKLLNLMSQEPISRKEIEFGGTPVELSLQS